MDCLKDYVGIYGCNRPEPASGLFINQLGISLESIDKLATQEQQNFLGVWDDVQTRAIKRLGMAITSHFATRYKLNRIQEVVAIGRENITAANVTPPGAQWRGFIYSQQNGDVPPQPKSDLQSLDIQSLSIYANVAGANITVGIFNPTTGALLLTKSIVSVLGLNYIEINRTGYVGAVFIGYYATIDGVEIKLDENAGCDCECSVACCNGTIAGATVDAATVNDFDISTLVKGNNTFGMGAVLSWRCDWAALVCATKSYFATALWYALGEELMAERIYSPRLNKFTTINRDEAKERRDEYKARYHEELQLAVDCITFDTNDCCIECNEQVIKREVCP